mgnify:CR=1 FL=1
MLFYHGEIFPHHAAYVRLYIYSKKVAFLPQYNSYNFSWESSKRYFKSRFVKEVRFAILKTCGQLNFFKNLTRHAMGYFHNNN